MVAFMAHVSYIALVQFFLLLHVAKQNVSSDKVSFNVDHNSTSSLWLRKQVDPRSQGCWNRPWICHQGEFPPKHFCCHNRCVDVTSDDNNCGICGFNCRFGHKCCGGLCVDLSNNPFHCGKCFKRCKFGIFCTFGMCGYANPPPKPFPPRPPHPFPPWPPHPPKPPHPTPICPPLAPPLSPPPSSPYYPPTPPLFPPPAPPYSSPTPPIYFPPTPPYSVPPHYTPPNPPYYTPPSTASSLVTTT